MVGNNNGHKFIYVKNVGPLITLFKKTGPFRFEVTIMVPY